MRFEFDTNDLSGRDVLILTAIATALTSSSAVLPARAPEATVGENGASGTTAPPSPSEATGESSQTTEASTDQGEDASAPVKRTRRTKAQIEADNLAADVAARAASQSKVTLSQSQQDAVDDTAGILTTEQKTAIAGAVAGTADAEVKISAEQVKQIVDLDALRAALQTYTGAHDLAAGIALLASFNCKRISEVLALDAERQQAFLLACHV